MYKRNKFESIKTDTLLMYVQSEAVKLKSDKVRQSSRTKSIIRRTRDLRVARRELMGRLEKMEWVSWDMFPDGALIEYEERQGVVISKNYNQKLFIKLDGDEFLIKVEASKLKLLHVREGTII